MLCALALTQARKVYFDYNLLNMQSVGMPAVVFEQKLIDSADKSVLYGAVIADSLPQAVELQKKIEKLPTVASNGVQSMASFLDEDQTEKLKLIGQIKQEVAPLQFSAADLQPVNIENFSRTLYSLYGYLGAALDEIKDSNTNLTAQIVSLREAINNLRKDMLSGDAAARAEHADKLAEFQRALFADMRETFQTLQNQDDSAPLRVEDLPAALRHRFVGVTGKFLLQVYPKYDVWQRKNQEAFIADLRTIDPNVTGTPVQLYEYTTLLKNSYETAAWYSLDRDCDSGLLPFPQSWRGDFVAAAGRHRHAVAGWPDGLAENSVQSGEHHDAAAGHRHRRDERHSHPEPVRRGAHAGHFVAQHRQGRARVGIDGHRRIRQPHACQTSGHPQSWDA